MKPSPRLHHAESGPGNRVESPCARRHRFRSRRVRPQGTHQDAAGRVEGPRTTTSGPSSAASVDYPDFAAAVARARHRRRAPTWASWSAAPASACRLPPTRFPGIRAAVVWDEDERAPEPPAQRRERHDPRRPHDAAPTGRRHRLGLPRHAASTAAATRSASTRSPRSNARTHSHGHHRQRRTAAACGETDPEVAAAIRDEVTRQATGLELIASENFVSNAVLEATGLGLHEQVRRGLPGAPLLRRLRVHRRRRAARHRPREGAVRRRARQRAAALGRAGQHGGVLRAAQARRHGARHEPVARRPPDARPPAELLGQALHDRALRRAPAGRAPRLRRTRAARRRAQAEDDHGRRQRLPARHRLPAHPRDRRPRRRGDGGRHGAHRGPGRRRRAPEPGAVRRFRHHHHAQDAARAAGGPRAVQGEVGEGPRPERVPRRAGRAAGARHRGQGRLLQGGRWSRRSRPTSSRSSPTPRSSPRSSRRTASASSRAAPTTT